MRTVFSLSAKALLVIVILLLCAGLVVDRVITHFVRGYVYSWNQRVSAVIETPNGPVEASSVQAMEVRYYPDGLLLSGNEKTRDLTGEAVVTDLGEGRFLFVLLGPKNLAESAYRDLRGEQTLKELLKQIRRQRDQGPHPIPRIHWPQMVSFTDINDPSTIVEVDPDNLAATFGEGYALRDLTIEATWDFPTEGRVEEVLGWWREYYEMKWRLNGETCVACPMRSNHLADLMGPGAFKLGYRK